MVKHSNERILPNSNDPTTFDTKVELEKGQNSVYIDMDRQFRATEGHPDCEYAGYWANGGNEQCTMYLAVEC